MDGIVARSEPFQRPRTADPYTGLPRAPYEFQDPLASYDAWNAGAEEWLGNLNYESAVRGMHPRELIQEWLLDCPAIDIDGIYPLTREEVHAAFDRVFNHVRASRDSFSASGPDQGVMRDLDRAARADDVAYGSHGQFAAERYTAQSQHLFRAFAEASYYGRCRRLGQVLYGFFNRRLVWIINNNTEVAIYQWCQALLRAELDINSKRECLRRVADVRADLFPMPNDPRGSSLSRLQGLLQTLIDDILGRSGRRDLPRRMDPFEPDDTAQDRHLASLEDLARLHENRARRARQAMRVLLGESLDEGSALRRRESMNSPWTRRGLLEL